MKELSIEEKVHRYDEAIKKAESLYKVAEPMSGCNVIIETIFPELKESEDERIRKWIIGVLSTYEHDRDLRNAAIAWLEKQAEQKPADKVEPKFKTGDWISGYYTNYKVLSVNNDGYVVEDVDGNKINILFENEKFHQLWTIQDAKDGDVLAVEPPIDENYQYPFVAIYKERGLDFFNSYCFIGFDGKFYEADTGHSTKKIHPATKEQRDLLFQKMKEAGYEWDAELKQLKKIEQNPTEDVNLPEFESYLCLMLQKFRTKGMCTNGEIIDYVKDYSQKLRDILVKSAWSEEDEKKLQLLIAMCDETKGDSVIYSTIYREMEELKTWLKSLKDR